MSGPCSILQADPGAKALRDIELAVRAGAAKALKARAAIQRLRATDGTSSAGEQFPDVTIRTGEAAVAARLAATLEQIADEIESEAAR
jgi:hypothetical protein